MLVNYNYIYIYWYTYIDIILVILVSLSQSYDYSYGGEISPRRRRGLCATGGASPGGSTLRGFVFLLKPPWVVGENGLFQCPICIYIYIIYTRLNHTYCHCMYMYIYIYTCCIFTENAGTKWMFVGYPANKLEFAYEATIINTWQFLVFYPPVA